MNTVISEVMMYLFSSHETPEVLEARGFKSQKPRPFKSPARRYAHEHLRV